VKLPGCDKAVIPNEKVRDYLLSDEHPVGRFKAAFFHALGYTRTNWHQLRCDLLVHASEGQAQGGLESPYGTRYEVRGIIEGPNGREASLVSVWIVRSGERAPRFVTAYPGEKP